MMAEYIHLRLFFSSNLQPKRFNFFNPPSLYNTPDTEKKGTDVHQCTNAPSDEVCIKVCIYNLS